MISFPFSFLFELKAKIVMSKGGGVAWRRRWWHPSRPVLVVLLPVAALLLCEYGLYYLALARCGSFPVPPPLPSGLDDTTEQDGAGDDLYLLVVADTHVLGSFTPSS